MTSMSDDQAPKRPRTDVPSSTAWVPKNCDKMTEQEITRKMNKFLDSSNWKWTPKPNGQFWMQGKLFERDLTVSRYPSTGKALFQGKENDVTFFKARWEGTKDF